MSDNEGSSHYASLLFLDQNHNSITGENINHHEDLEDASSDCYSVLPGPSLRMGSCQTKTALRETGLSLKTMC